MLAATGHKFPFIVLSSFEQSVVCWRQDEQTAATLASTESLRYKSVTSEAGTPGKLSECAEPLSASPPVLNVPLLSKTAEETLPNGFFLKAQERALHKSKIHEAHELVRLLYSAIMCALKDCDQIRTRNP